MMIVKELDKKNNLFWEVYISSLRVELKFAHLHLIEMYFAINHLKTHLTETIINNILLCESKSHEHFDFTLTF